MVNIVIDNVDTSPEVSPGQPVVGLRMFSTANQIGRQSRRIATPIATNCDATSTERYPGLIIRNHPLPFHSSSRKRITGKYGKISK